MGGQQTKHGLSDKFVGAMLLGTAIMNAIDLLMTLWLVKTGLATEANPLMRIALNAGVVAFAFSKVTLVDDRRGLPVEHPMSPGVPVWIGARVLRLSLRDDVSRTGHQAIVLSPTVSSA